MYQHAPSSAGIFHNTHAHNFKFLVPRRHETASQYFRIASLTNRALGSVFSLMPWGCPDQSRRKGSGRGVRPYMANVFVSQKRMSILQGIFGKRCEPGGYISPAVWGSGPGWQQPCKRNQYGYITHAKSVDWGSISKVPKKDAWCAPGVLTLPQRQAANMQTHNIEKKQHW